MQYLKVVALIIEQIFLMIKLLSQYFLYYYFHHRSFLMRSRSGAFHCESQQDFIQLSLASQNYTGIFYDERINKKIMKALHPHRQTQQIINIQEIANPQSNSQKKRNNFTGFDFGLENECELQEKKELQRMNINVFKQVNIGLINNNDNERLNHLRREVGQQEDPNNQDRQFDLDVVKTNKYILKFWLFDTAASKIQRNPILQLYRTKCDIILEIDSSKNIRIINNKKEEALQQVIGQLNNKLNNITISMA